MAWSTTASSSGSEEGSGEDARGSNVPIVREYPILRGQMGVGPEDVVGPEGVVVVGAGGASGVARSNAAVAVAW